MHTAGTIFNPEETLQLIHLTAEVTQRHFRQISVQHAYHPSEGIIEESASFLQTGSSWLRELTIDNVCNWSLINQLTTELILNVMAHRQDDPITLGNCICILCLLSLTDEFGGKIRGLGGVEKIIKLLPRQFSEKRGEDTSHSTWTQNNNNLRFTLRTLRHLTEPDINNPYYPRIGTGANLRMVLGTLRAWGGDEISKGLTLQVLYNLMREVDKMHDTPQRRPLPRPDISPGEARGATGACHAYLGTHIDPYLNSTEEGSAEPRPITQAQGLLYRLETVTHTIEQVTRTLLNQSSHHHVTQSMGLRILQGLTPRGYILTTRTPRERDLKWAHPASCTYFDTPPDLATIVVNLTHWHSYEGTWKTMEGTILVPLSGNIAQLIQMLLWNHPYVELTSFLQGTTAYNTTLGDRIKIPLNSEIRTLGSTAQKIIIHLLLPHWESGHLDLTPRSGKLLMEEILVGTKHNNPETNRVTTWSHDGGEVLGRLGVQIIGGHKLNPYPASLMPPQRLPVTIIDHCMNLQTPWSTNMRPLPDRLLILGNSYSKAVDLQIPTQPGQTCIDAILLTLQIIGCQKDRISWKSEGIQAFTPDHLNKQGLRYPSPSRSESTGLFNISHHSTLADYMKPNGR